MENTRIVYKDISKEEVEKYLEIKKEFLPKFKNLIDQLTALTETIQNNGKPYTSKQNAVNFIYLHINQFYESIFVLLDNNLVHIAYSLLRPCWDGILKIAMLLRQDEKAAQRFIDNGIIHANSYKIGMFAILKPYHSYNPLSQKDLDKEAKLNNEYNFVNKTTKSTDLDEEKHKNLAFIETHFSHDESVPGQSKKTYLQRINKEIQGICSEILHCSYAGISYSYSYDMQDNSIIPQVQLIGKIVGFVSEFSEILISLYSSTFQLNNLQLNEITKRIEDIRLSLGSHQI